MPLRSILKALPPPTPPESLGDDSIQEFNLSAVDTTNGPSLPFTRLSYIPPLDSPHVHFPPTPTLAHIELTYSRLSYDRKPISVSPNLCALPGRGERKLDPFHTRQLNTEPRPFGVEERYPSSSSGTESQSRKAFERRRCLSTNNEIITNVSSPAISDHTGVAPDFSDQTTCVCRGSLKLSRGPKSGFLDSRKCEALPALIFEPSSKSESDACISPGADLSLPPSISHISTHFSSGAALATGGQSRTKSIFSVSAPHISLNFGKRPMKRYRKWEKNRKPSNVDVEEQSEGILDEAIYFNNNTGCPARSTQTWTRNIDDTRTGLSRRYSEWDTSFESGLDGCLGGF